MKAKCPLCGRAYSNSTAVVEHIKKEHSGKLSQLSFDYLRSLGVPVEKIIRFCEENGIRMAFRVQHQTTLDLIF